VISTENRKTISLPRLLMHPSCPDRVVYDPLCEEITNTFSKLPDDLSVTTVCMVQGHRRLRSGEKDGEHVLESTVPSQEACASGKKTETHHHGLSKRVISRHLTLLSDSFCAMTLDKPLSNRFLTNAYETPDGTFTGTPTLTSRNQHQKQGLHNEGSQGRIHCGMLCQEVQHCLCC